MTQSPLTNDGDRRTFRWLVWLLVVAAVVTLAPLWLPILLAAWFAQLAGGVGDRLARLFGGRRGVAAWIVLALLVAMLIPFTVATISLITTAVALVRRALETPEWRSAVRSILSDGDTGVRWRDLVDPQHVMELVRQHGGQAWSFLSSFFGITAEVVIELFVFFIGAYAFLVDGERHWAWLASRIPLERGHLERLRQAFRETGRGIVISIGLTSLSQAVVATVAYAALGVPRAMILGELTFFAAFIPSFGTALVWVPVAAALALSGEVVRALVLTAIGVFVVGTIDNFLRPLFSRWGHLDLPVFVLIFAIFGGFAVFGAWGFVLGPLFVRLAREALDIAKEERPL
jgi:predicted PurR-regulated permease PerM